MAASRGMSQQFARLRSGWAPGSVTIPAPLPPMEAPRLQATLFDFAITELVRQHRDSFQPAWTAECWSKLLIWLALNCGCSPEQAELEAFAPTTLVGTGGELMGLTGAQIIPADHADPVAIARLARIKPVTPPRPLYRRAPDARLPGT